jgi:hypothetical protein
MHQVAAAEAGGKVYVAGGWDGGKYLRSVEVYDTAVSSWVNAPRYGGLGFEAEGSGGPRRCTVLKLLCTQHAR